MSLLRRALNQLQHTILFLAKRQACQGIGSFFSMRSLVNALIAVLYRGQNTVLGSFGGITFGSPAKRFCEADNT